MNTTLPPIAPHPNDALPTPRGRLTVDAPTRAFHWLFALCFTGAWITAESERWRHVHETLGYTFGGLLAFRLVYGLIGPRQARLSLLWHRASGWRAELSKLVGGQLDLQRMGTRGLGTAMLAMLAVAAPLVLSGHAGQAGWWGLDDLLEEVHELLANTAMALVLAHLGLIALLSVWRRRNLAMPMLTGRTAGPGADSVKANRLWLAGLVMAACVGFVAWQLSAPPGAPARIGQGASGQVSLDGNHPGDRDHDDEDDD